MDDTFGCFKYLDQNTNSNRSIWNSTTFSKAKEIYQKYGITTDFYCIYSDGYNNLDNFGALYKDQFIECSDWMKFGFHAFCADSNYNDISAKGFLYEYIKTYEALIKLVGKDSTTDCIRLHFFSGNKSISKVLKEQGISTLLCADDDRISYGLSINEQEEINSKGVYIDSESKIIFRPTHFRLENLHSKPNVDLLENLPGERLEIFTHERYLTDDVIMKRLEWFL